MKLYCLSSNPSKPCLVLQFKSVQVMLDCSLDISQLQHFVPSPVVASSRSLVGRSWTPTGDKALPQQLSSEIKECGGRLFVDAIPEFCLPLMNMVDFSQLDAILISNMTCMLALPFITEYTQFKGQVFATEPSLQIGKQYMEELVTYVERNSKDLVATKWKEESTLKLLPAPLKEAVKPWLWRKCYTMHDVNASLSKVQLVGFNEKKSIYGCLDVLASSSGFALGSANWVIQSEYEKVCYVSGSSTLTTHPRPMDQTPLRNSDVLILSCLTQTPLTNPDSMIGEFCLNVALTIKNGGNVLVPCYPSGITFDLFECVSGHMESCGLGQVPMYFLSPVAENTLAYSNIFAEWCSQGKQSKVYLPEPPFPHADLVSNGRLKPFISIHDGLTGDFKQPCIVFAGHPSLRLGDAVHFIELWGKSSGNTIIFTEPDFPYMAALAPFQPLAIRVCYCPIDTSLNFTQANKLIKELRPLHLVVPESYMSPPVLQPHRTDLTIDWEPAPLTYKMGEVVSLPIRRKFERIEIAPELAATLEPVEVKPGSAVSLVTGALIAKDNKYILESVPKEMVQSRKRQADGTLVRPKPFIYGTLNIRQFVNILAEDGITDVKVEDLGEGHIIHLDSDDTLIQVEPESTHIICQGNQTIRTKLRDTLLQCLSKL